MSRKARQPKPISDKVVEADETADAIAVISGRLSQELVFALVGPIASGVTTTATILREELTKFGYEIMPDIRISEIISKEAHRVGKSGKVTGSKNNRIEHLQNVGNELRKKFGSDYLAKKAVREIAEVRMRDGYEEISAADVPRPKVIRRAWIIDSL